MMNRVRVRFRKQGDFRLTSHRDLMRAVERLFRRADVKICETEGFHPKPRVHYPTSLALGMTGIDEVLEADLAEEISPEELLVRMNAQTVPGLEFTSVEPMPSDVKRGQPRQLCFQVTVPTGRAGTLEAKVAEFVAAKTWLIDRDKKRFDIRPLIAELSYAEPLLTMKLLVVNEANARPRDVLEALGFTPEEFVELDITRTQVEMVA
jgi:radical SAM-linked protein